MAEADDNWLEAEVVACSGCGERLFAVLHSPFCDDYRLYCDRCPRVTTGLLGRHRCSPRTERNLRLQMIGVKHYRHQIRHVQQELTSNSDTEQPKLEEETGLKLVHQVGDARHH